jgi:hypothetical protein
MSVTFHPSLHNDDLVGFDIVCYDDDVRDSHPERRRFPDYARAEVAYLAGLDAGTVDRHCCSLSPVWSIDTDTYAVNLSNANARELLENLGLAGDDLVGHDDPTDFAGRVLIARALVCDDGVPASTVVGERGATMHLAGRQPGYWAQVYDRLDRLVLQCERLGRTIVWG